MAAAQVALAGLKSLDVQFPTRGVEYLFVTPRGEIAIEARAIGTGQWQRILPLGGLVLAIAVVGFAARIGRRYRERAKSKRRDSFVFAVPRKPGWPVHGMAESESGLWAHTRISGRRPDLLDGTNSGMTG